MITSNINSNDPNYSYQYDPNGNLTTITGPAGNSSSYVYDSANHLTSATNPTGAVITYGYDGFGNRISQTFGGATTNYFFDPTGSIPQLLAEMPGSGSANPATYYLPGLGQDNGKMGYFGMDALGSVRQITDSNGVMQYAANFDPYGSLLEQNYGTASTSLGYTGAPSDPSGLVYLNARFYNPSLGSFQTHDPFGGLLGSPASQNGYSYTEGNPSTFADPSGKCIDPISFAVCAALLVGGAAFIGAVTGAAYDVFVNQGVGLGGKNQGDFSSVNLGEAAFNSGIGAGIGTSIGFIGSQIAGVAAVAGTEGLGSLALTQVARAALWNVTGTLFADSLAYHGLQQYNNTGGVDLGSLATQESSNPLLGVAFFGDMALGAYEGYQSLGGWAALRAQLQNIDESLLRAGRWYADTFDLNAVTVGGLPILNNGYGEPGGSGLTTVIGRMEDLTQFANDPTIDTWAKSGRIPDDPDDARQRVTWPENRKWLEDRVIRGDKFGIATDPKTLPPVKGGYIEGEPNGYFTARELEQLRQWDIEPIPMYRK